MTRIRTILLICALLASGFGGARHSQALARDVATSAPADPVAAQTNLRWTSRIGYRSGHLVFSLKDAAGQPVHGATVTASISRRLGACLCRTLVLFERKPGIYAAPSPLPASGTWDVSVTAAWQGETYEANGVVTANAP